MRPLPLLLGALLVYLGHADKQINLCRTSKGEANMADIMAQLKAIEAAKTTTMSFLDRMALQVDPETQIYIRTKGAAFVLPKPPPTTKDPPATKATDAPSSPKPKPFTGKGTLVPGEFDPGNDVVQTVSTTTKNDVEVTAKPPKLENGGTTVRIITAPPLPTFPQLRDSKQIVLPGAGSPIKRS